MGPWVHGPACGLGSKWADRQTEPAGGQAGQVGRGMVQEQTGWRVPGLAGGQVGSGEWVGQAGIWVVGGSGGQAGRAGGSGLVGGRISGWAVGWASRAGWQVRCAGIFVSLPSPHFILLFHYLFFWTLPHTAFQCDTSSINLAKYSPSGLFSYRGSM